MKKLLVQNILENSQIEIFQQGSAMKCHIEIPVMNEISKNNNTTALFVQGKGES